MRVQRQNVLDEEAVELKIVLIAESLIHFMEKNPCCISISEKNNFLN